MEDFLEFFLPQKKYEAEISDHNHEEVTVVLGSEINLLIALDNQLINGNSIFGRKVLRY